MKKIENLTPEQEAKMPVYRDKWLDKMFKYELYKNHTFENTEKAMKRLYRFCNLKEPQVFLVDSPMACQEKVRELKKAAKIEFEPFSSYINYSDFSWLSFYDFFMNECGLIEEHRESLEMVTECVHNSFMQIQLEDYCIVSKFPKRIERNERNDMHCTTGYAVEFDDGYGQHYVNGRFIEADVFNNSQTIAGAKKAFDKTDNEDIRACIVTIVKENHGNKGLLEMLNAVLIDEKELKHENGYTEIIRIYQTKDKHEFAQNSKGESNQPFAWIEMTCPSTKTVYLQETCPTFTDAAECIKWHRPANVPFELPYIWQSAN